MESLPHLALDLVFGFLASMEPSRASLVAFASTSWACRAAAWHELFSRISIGLDTSQLPQRLEQLERFLDEKKSRAHVKVLQLGAKPVHKINQEDGETSDTHDLWMRGPDWGTRRSLRGWKPIHESHPDQFWQPLSRFISSLRLRDLLWMYTEQLPGCVLSVLNEQVPTCRLHIQRFDLRSAHQSEAPQDFENTEYMLVTSPCLYRFVAPYATHDAGGGLNYNEEAILELVAGLAPNLKHICVWDNTISASGELNRPIMNPRPNWRGFYPQSRSDWCAQPRNKGQLHTLVIDPYHVLEGPRLASWERQIDFSTLYTLRLGRGVGLDALQMLAHLAELDGLPQLETLSLPRITCDYVDRMEAQQALKRLLISLSSLVELAVVGPGVSAFEAIVTKHGNRLRVFRVQGSILSLQQVALLRLSCPEIRKLSVEILRSASDRVEVETYRTLGSIQALESLSLELKCTEYDLDEGNPNAPWGCVMPSKYNEDDLQELQELQAAIHGVFINAAVDKSLARSIFRQILDAHSSAQTELPQRMKTILLRMPLPGKIHRTAMFEDFYNVLAWIGESSWICRGDRQGIDHSNPVVEEIRSDRRTRSGKELEDDIDEVDGWGYYADVWKGIWPQTEAGWKNDWHSFPLAIDDENVTGDRAL